MIEPVDVQGPGVWCLIYNAASALAGRGKGMIDGRVLALVLMLDSRGAQSIKGVARALNLSPSTASDVVRRARAQGLVSQRLDPGNNRAHMVNLTAVAQQRLRRMRA